MFLALINKIQPTSFLLILLSSFMGAFFAFTFNVYRERRKQFRRNIQTLNECKFFLQALCNFQEKLRKHIVASMNYYSKTTKERLVCDIEDYWRAVTPFYVTIELPDLAELSLSFLLDNKCKGEKLLEWIYGQNAACQSVRSLLKQRNSMEDDRMRQKMTRSISLTGSSVRYLNEITAQLVNQNKNALLDYEASVKSYESFIQNYRSFINFFRRFLDL